MLKYGHIYPGKKCRTMRYRRWLQEQPFDHPAHYCPIRISAASRTIQFTMVLTLTQCIATG